MLFNSFLRDSGPSSELCAKYSPLLPAELTAVWKTYGFGTLLDGYLKLTDPEDYRSLLCDSYVLGDDAIPIFVTAFADIVTWERGRYIRMVRFRDGTFQGMAAGFNFFWGDLGSGAFDRQFFDLALYKSAVDLHGPLQFDECFGFVPLLGLGGRKSADCLRKVKIKEHIALITQALGKVGANL